MPRLSKPRKKRPERAGLGRPPYKTAALHRRLGPLLSSAGAREAYLFGSHARGDADQDSNVDVAIIADTALPFVERFQQFTAVLDAVPEAQLLVYTPREWEEMRLSGASLYLGVTEHCVALLGADIASPVSARARVEARRWQLQAENDLAYARVGLAGGFATQTCFMAHQVTEKALKAALLATGAKNHQGHSCAQLGVKLTKAIPELEAMRPDLVRLDHYYVPTRSRNGIPRGTQVETHSLMQAEQAVVTAARICDLTRPTLNRLCPGWEDSETLAAPSAVTGPAPADLYALSLLEALRAEPSLSQRKLAQQVSLPLSKVHFVLMRLIKKGLVKIKNVRDSKHRLGYLYVLTPSGIEAKAKLTYRFLQRTAADYQSMRERVEKALDLAIGKAKNGEPRVTVALLGDGPLGAVVRDVLEAREDAEITADVTLAKVVVLIDREVARPECPETAVVEFA